MVSLPGEKESRHSEKGMLFFLSLPLCRLAQWEKKICLRTSLVAQWLRIRLPMQGTQVQALVREDPACRGATKPVRHNY